MYLNKTGIKPISKSARSWTLTWDVFKLMFIREELKNWFVEL